MENQPVHPEDILPDGADTTHIGGLLARKGSVAAFIANARALDHVTPGSAQEVALIEALRTLAPTLKAIGLTEVFVARSPRIASLLDDAN